MLAKPTNHMPFYPCLLYCQNISTYIEIATAIDTLPLQKLIVTLVFHIVYMHNEEYLHVAIEYEETPASNQRHKWVEDLSNVCLHVYME